MLLKHILSELLILPTLICHRPVNAVGLFWFFYFHFYVAHKIQIKFHKFTIHSVLKLKLQPTVIG